MSMRKFTKLAMAIGVTAALAACSNKSSENTSSESSSSTASTAATESTSSQESGGAYKGAITVITREDGSGTREGFEKVVGLDNGPVSSASVQSSTDAVMTTVAGDPLAIGYVSLGDALNKKDIKILKVEGTEATPENVANDSYKISRPFNLVYKDELKGAAADFRDFILSSDGQDIIEKDGFVPVDSQAKAYAGKEGSQSGTINIAGSTSVGPVMEKLAEAYKKKQPKVTINITQNGSGAGVTAAQDGTADIGMASRALKDDEKGVKSEAIAKDGIAIIVNPKNTTENITLADLKSVYTGEITDWSDLKG